MTGHDDTRITDWLARDEGRAREAALDAALAAARMTRQRPAWAVSLRGGTLGGPRGRVLVWRGAAMVAAALLVGGLLVGALAAGGVLRIRQPSQPDATHLAIAPDPSSGPTTEPAASDRAPSPSAPTTTRAGAVAYVVVTCRPAGSSGTRLECDSQSWLAAADGGDAHVLDGGIVGWSADGSRLVLVRTGPGSAVKMVIADPTGAVVSTVDVPCDSPIVDEKYGGPVCPDVGEYALSPDGTRVAFTRTDSNVGNASVLSVLDLRTGKASTLEATRTTNPPVGDLCNTSTTRRSCQGFDGMPRWSPDGRMIAFERQSMAPESGASWDSAAVYVVDADGTDLRRVTPPSLHAIGPAWSPDGTRLAVDGMEQIVNAGGTRVDAIRDDIYTVDLDGGVPGRLTDDGISSLPDWTADGRLAFIRNAAPSGSEHWIMDADGGNVARLGATLGDLTAAGCTTCVYVAKEPVTGMLPRAYWQPRP